MEHGNSCRAMPNFNSANPVPLEVLWCCKIVLVRTGQLSHLQAVGAFAKAAVVQAERRKQTPGGER